MFLDYFFYLKEILPVSITEFLTLLEALNKGLIKNMVEFYYISRSILCKNEHHFDIYDIAFANFFKDASIKFPEEIQQEIWDWLNKDVTIHQLPAIMEKLFPNMTLAELEEQFRRLLQEQDEEHNFGDRWIGTLGQSKFGNLGQNNMGIRIAGEDGMHSAVKIAQKRMFKDYRKDLVMNTRRIKIALRRLRRLDEIGKRDELDLQKTIDETCKNGGDIELFFSKKKKNNIKLLLLMDVGGTMDPYIYQVNLLFSAANNISHWKDFRYYYFHNCIYNYLYDDARSELVNPHGAMYDDASNKKAGMYYINEIANHFQKNVIWINPEPVRPEWMSWTKLKISKIIPTFHLSIQGIENAMDYLRTGGKNHYTTVDHLKDVILALY
jgi:uncharacterized protein with von Willebrand factor type A (vWA) domain